MPSLHGLTVLFRVAPATLAVLWRPFDFDPASANQQKQSQRWPTLFVFRLYRRAIISILREEHVLGEQFDQSSREHAFRAERGQCGARRTTIGECPGSAFVKDDL